MQKNEVAKKSNLTKKQICVQKPELWKKRLSAIQDQLSDSGKALDLEIAIWPPLKDQKLYNYFPRAIKLIQPNIGLQLTSH